MIYMQQESNGSFIHLYLIGHRKFLSEVIYGNIYLPQVLVKIKPLQEVVVGALLMLCKIN